ncbi:MAG: hypothetical protein H7223_10385 [Pedobacter sp.]|nr:hypothetical protein [Pedobacter sp.]
MEQRSIDFKQCYVQRIIELPTVAGKFITTSYKPATGSYDYFEKESDDFGFELNHVSYSGKSKWQLAGINTISDANKGYGVSVRLVSEDQKVEVRWNSEMHKDSIHFERLFKKAPVSTERSYYRDELSRVAFGLKQLKQAGVQILWRPFHEMNGNWFWWGPDNPRNPSNINSYQALWKDMYETFTKDFGLDNLIWVYAPFSSDGSVMPSVNAYYPGDQYVDIVAVDVYPVTPNFDDYNELKKLGKLVANGEIGPTKESYGHFDQMAVIKVLSGKASYFLQWSSWWKANVNIVDNLNYKQMMNDPSVITLDKMR